MWEPLTYDNDLMTHVADIWDKPLAGYLPSPYRQVLAGGRLIALSKHPKPGVRPICISDALRWLTGRGLLKRCQPYFGQYFQESRPNVLQFGGGIKNGATFMHILLSSIHHLAALPDPAQAESADPIAFLSLDSSNAFNCLTRKQLSAVLLNGCAERLRSASASPAQADSQPQPHGWNLLWKFIASHYGCHGLLKFFHSGTVTDINSESGVQQGDPLGSTLFALAIHPVLLDLGRSFPSLLITAYADNVIFAGPLSVLRDAHDRYSEQMQAICLRVNSCKSAVFVPQWQHWQVDTYEHILARPEVQQHLFQAAQAPVTSFPCRVAPRSPSLETASQSLAHQLEPQRTA